MHCASAQPLSHQLQVAPPATAAAAVLGLAVSAIALGSPPLLPHQTCPGAQEARGGPVGPGCPQLSP